MKTNKKKTIMDFAGALSKESADKLRRFEEETDKVYEDE